MSKVGQILLTIGIAMFAAGMSLPFFVGTAIPAAGYNLLQIGGPLVAIVGFVVRAIGKKAATGAG